LGVLEILRVYCFRIIGVEVGVVELVLGLQVEQKLVGLEV
jgi:hypothetical protein